MILWLLKMFKKIDHIIEGKKKLLHQFKNKKIINIFLECLMFEINEIEEAIEQLNINRSLKNAIGKQIDSNGEIRNVLRNDLNDEYYKQKVLNKIALDNSDGTILSILSAAKIILNNNKFVYKETYPARVELFSNNSQCSLFQYKYIANSVGVCVSLDLKYTLDDKPFGFNNNKYNGYGTIYNNTNTNKGGGYASIIGDLNNE